MYLPRFLLWMILVNSHSRTIALVFNSFCLQRDSWLAHFQDFGVLYIRMSAEIMCAIPLSCQVPW